MLKLGWLSGGALLCCVLMIVMCRCVVLRVWVRCGCLCGVARLRVVLRCVAVVSAMVSDV